MVSGSGPRYLYQDGDFWITWGVDKSGHLHIAARRNEYCGRAAGFLVVEIETTATRGLQNEGLDDSKEHLERIISKPEKRAAK